MFCRVAFVVKVAALVSCIKVSRSFSATTSGPDGRRRHVLRAQDESRSGFVAVVGSPNVGKSTLVNAFVGQKLCIATSKAQTTRHSILGIAEGPGFQMCLTDTPGILQEPAYALQRAMVSAARRACRDAEVVLFMTDIFEAADAASNVRRWVGESLKGSEHDGPIPLVVAVNKVDLLAPDSNVTLGPEALALVGSEELALTRAREACPDAVAVVPISARSGANVDALRDVLVSLLPVSPPVYGDALTDRPSRFFAAEIIREQILKQYSKEVPYSCEVVVTRFKENDPAILEIDAKVIVARESQKAILIGRQGAAIKSTGIAARENLEDFFQVPKVRLDLRVKVQKNWRSDDTLLKRFGYS